MKLEEFRKEQGLTYKSLGELLGFTENKTYRTCTDKKLCVKLIDATRIQRLTGGMVELEDLVGDC
jgi:hypothetical protein